MRVSASDLAYFNLTSIPLADGSGYAAELGVHHELHCLVCARSDNCEKNERLTFDFQKKIRHWIYRDYYLGNETSAELEEWKFHICRSPNVAPGSCGYP